MSTSLSDSRTATDSATWAERPWLRGVFLAIALVCACWIGVTASYRVQDLLGQPAGCVTLAASKSSAIITFGSGLVLMTILAMVAARLINSVVGVFVLGFGLAGLTLVSSSVSGAFFVDASSSSLAIETMIWGIAIAVAVVAIFRVGGAPPDIALRYPGESIWREYFDANALRAGLTGVLLPLLAWVIVRTMMKGQAFGGACIGGVAVGIAYRMVAPHVQPVFAFIAPILLTGAYQLLSSRSTGNTGVAFALNTISPEMRLLPMDVVAGSLIGVAMGIGWARGLRRSDTISS